MREVTPVFSVAAPAEVIATALYVTPVTVSEAAFVTTSTTRIRFDPVHVCDQVIFVVAVPDPLD